MSVRLHGRVQGAPLTLSPAPPRTADGPPARPVRLEPLIGAPKRTIATRLDRIEVWFVMDDSGSMYATWGDPTGIRYAAALSLLRLMREASGGYAGVVHWGSTAPDEMVTGPLPVRRRRPLNASLAVPATTLGGNDLPAALRRTAERADRDRAVLACVITDGIETVTDSTHESVSALPPGSVHLLLVDRARQCDPAMEAAWRAVAFGSFTRLNTFNTRAMAEQLAAVLSRALGLA